jgi:hypothetical protein
VKSSHGDCQEWKETRQADNQNDGDTEHHQCRTWCIGKYFRRTSAYPVQQPAESGWNSSHYLEDPKITPASSPSVLKRLPPRIEVGCHVLTPFHEKCRYAESALKAVLNGPTKDLYSCVVCLDLIYVL